MNRRVVGGLLRKELLDVARNRGALLPVVLVTAIAVIEKSLETMPDEGTKNNDTPRIGHKLHRLTTMTSKTPQFHLLANGNPKPENLLVSPLAQFELDGSPKAAMADAVATGASRT